MESDRERMGRRFAKAKLTHSDNVARTENRPIICVPLATIVALDAAYRD